MKIISYDFFGDDGSVELRTDEGVFCIDGSIHSAKRGVVYKGVTHEEERFFYKATPKQAIELLAECEKDEVLRRRVPRLQIKAK